MPAYDPPGKLVLLHSPAGLRVEFSAGPREGRLELWISPGTRHDCGHWRRNFSNRDDHTRLFDAIVLPGLDEAAFEGCDYDAFHTTLRFSGGRVLHLAPLADLPALALWCEHAQAVDLKSDKQDHLIARAPDAFAVHHPDRGLALEFHARLPPGGASRVRHQTLHDRGRSVHARAELVPGEALLLGGEESAECVDISLVPRLAALASAGPAALLDEQAAFLAPLLAPGRLALAEEPEIQRLAEVNRRVLVAMQDHQGAVRAALNRIYYLIWVRDGAVIAAYQATAGDARALRLWRGFLLANPTRFSAEAGGGRGFGMLVNPITKLEEDGIFYAVWTAFLDWTQGGTLPSAAELAVLQDAVAWLERRCWDEERGLFGRYYRCEEPFGGSLDHGFDNAVGRPGDAREVLWLGRHAVRRSYDLYINRCGRHAWLLLAMLLEAAGRPAEAAPLRARSERLAGRLRDWPGGDAPAYGWLRDADGAEHLAEPYGLDACDYQWALSVPPFPERPANHAAQLEGLVARFEEPGGRHFLAAVFAVLAAVDPLDLSEHRLLQIARSVAKTCAEPGRFLAMPWTIVEMTGVEDGDLWHDVRPQAFSAAPFLGALANLVLRRLPFGLALRPSAAVNSIHDYAFGGATLSIELEGEGDDLAWSFDGYPQPDLSWQIPSSLLRAGARHTVKLGRRAASPESGPPLLVWSTVELRAVEPTPAGGARFHLAAHGENHLRLRRAASAPVRLIDASGRAIALAADLVRGADRWISFGALGACVVEIGPRPAA